MIKTIGRFTIGIVLGFCGVVLFTDNAHIALIVAVLCGVAVDKLLRR